MSDVHRSELIDWTCAEWRRSAFCGESSCVEVAQADGRVAVRDSKRPDVEPLVFSGAEWSAFVAGVKAGAFDPPS